MSTLETRAPGYVLGVEARLAKTDAMLLLTIVAALGAMARAYLAGPAQERRGWLLPAMFWTALAGGVLLKGPMILMIVALVNFLHIRRAIDAEQFHPPAVFAIVLTVLASLIGILLAIYLFLTA